MKELREIVDAESDALVSKLIERIKSKTLKELFSQAMVSEIKIDQEDARKTVSYTHLTLPTIYSV